jgi:hypothetical protein
VDFESVVWSQREELGVAGPVRRNPLFNNLCNLWLKDFPYLRASPRWIARAENAWQTGIIEIVSMLT